MTESGGVPTYTYGAQIKAEVRFPREPGAERVVAFFTNQQDPYAHAALVGNVSAGSGGLDQALIQGSAIVINDAYGEYRCVSLHVELGDGKRVAFETPPDIRFRVVPEHQRTSEPAGNGPTLSSWNWV